MILMLLMAVLSVARTSIDNYSVNVSRNTLQQVKTIIDTKIEEIHNIVFQLYTSQKLAGIKQHTDIFAKNNILETLDYQKTLENYNVYNRYILFNFTLFINDSYVIMSNAGQDSVSFSRQFYNDDHPEGFDFESFKNFLSQYDTEFTEKLTFSGATDSTAEVIPYVKWLKTTGKTKSIAIVVLLDASKVSELLRQSLTAKSSAFCIVDENNRIIVSSREITETEYDALIRQTGIVLDGERIENNFTAFSEASKNMPWRYVLLSDNREISKALDVMLVLIVIVGVVCLITAVAVSAAVIHKNSLMLKPIFELVDSGNLELKRNDIYLSLKQSIKKMQEDKTFLDKRYREQEAVIQEVYLNNLLKGDKADYDDQMKMIEALGFYRPDSYYYVAVASIRFTDEAAYAHNEIQNMKNIIFESVKLYSKMILPCNISKLEMALIISTKYAQDEKQNREFVELLYDLLKQIVEKDNNTCLMLSVGGIHTGDSAIPVSFSEAKLNYNASVVETHKGIVWFQGTESPHASYYYPPEAEIQLINAIRSGNRPLVEEIIKELFDINFKEKQMSYEFLIVFLHDFYGSILKAIINGDRVGAIQKEIYEFYANNVNEIGTIEFQQKFLKYIYALTDSYNRNKKSHNALLLDKIKGFILENYDNCDMTMYRVADEFNLSSGYLSAFFKEQAGLSFSDFITNTKMEKASKFVLDTRLSINEIAQKTGYASANTFCRAFRKFYGISPMEMRMSKGLEIN